MDEKIFSVKEIVKIALRKIVAETADSPNHAAVYIIRYDESNQNTRRRCFRSNLHRLMGSLPMSNYLPSNAFQYFHNRPIPLISHHVIFFSLSSDQEYP
ncbi:hypothetical protein AVEN_41714-1 [Araneus ventricosus]|uniref:Uncharacterized protein n=1 Tax=Araneus ventricosus TaxID=182803 RepID=A0A4Y2ADD3_ARAVE|nr:hypothetical protein AVEN_41714-1 [Araneus ventricosus]